MQISLLRRQNGCVTCGATKPCPPCPKGQHCVVTEMTCFSCPEPTCKTKEVLNSYQHHSNGGKIAGGVVGGVVGGIVLGVAILLFWLYHRYWKKILAERKDRLTESREMYGEGDGDADLDDLDSISDHDASEDEMNDVVQELPTQVSNIQNGSRNSTITTHTKASNILPIAYIPGVTIRPPVASRLRNGDVRSHITLGSSILGPDDSSVHSQAISNSHTNPTSNENSDTVGSLPISTLTNPEGQTRNLTTAIKAKPRLVQIDESAEGEEVLDIGEQVSESPQEKAPDHESDAGSGSFILDVAGPDPSFAEEKRPISPFADPEPDQIVDQISDQISDQSSGHSIDQTPNGATH